MFYVLFIYNISGGHANPNQRWEFVYPIQHGYECCKWLVKRLDQKIELKVYVNHHELDCQHMTTAFWSWKC
jgi:hypothetical protein